MIQIRLFSYTIKSYCKRMVVTSRKTFWKNYLTMKHDRIKALEFLIPNFSFIINESRRSPIYLALLYIDDARMTKSREY